MRPRKSERVKFQFEMPRENADRLEQLASEAVTTKREIISNALAIFDWVVEEVKANKIVGSVEEDGSGDFDELVSPLLLKFKSSKGSAQVATRKRSFPGAIAATGVAEAAAAAEFARRVEAARRVAAEVAEYAAEHGAAAAAEHGAAVADAVEASRKVAEVSWVGHKVTVEGNGVVDKEEELKA